METMEHRTELESDLNLTISRLQITITREQRATFTGISSVSE